MREISIEKLEPGVFYLAKDKNHDKYRYQGTFECIEKPGPIRFAKFNDTKDNNGTELPILKLSESEFIFFEKDAVINAYTNSVLRQIIGDPDFSYDQKEKR